jgi:hypothetical protein
VATQQSAMPDTWRGSKASYIAFEALLRAGRRPGIDFSYQPRTQGRRLESEVEVDFVFRSPPNLAMQVQEPLYDHHSGIQTRGTDVLAKAKLAVRGVTLIMLGHDRLVQDPDWVISEALQYRDHTWG